jgi:hypothetical protein
MYFIEPLLRVPPRFGIGLVRDYALRVASKQNVTFRAPLFFAQGKNDILVGAVEFVC